MGGYPAAAVAKKIQAVRKSWQTETSESYQTTLEVELP